MSTARSQHQSQYVICLQSITNVRHTQTARLASNAELYQCSCSTQNTKTMPNYLTTMHKKYDHDTG